MIVYFDRYYLNSRSASALLLKERVRRDGFEDVLIFCTTTVYKTTFEEDLLDTRVRSEFLFSFNNTLKLYLGFTLFMILNNRKVDKVVSFSSPGFNVFFHGYSFWSKRTTYVVQDIFPENIGLIFPLFFRFRHFWRPFFKLAYLRLSNLETISVDMAEFLRKIYKVDALIRYNPNPYPPNLNNIEKQHLSQDNTKVVFGYSGNLSNSHGLLGPKKLLEVLCDLSNIEINVRGFGKYFDLLSNEPQFLNKIFFGGSLDSKEYEKYLNRLDVLLLFQEDGYEKVCLSCKFNTVIELGKPIVYVGPHSDISRYISILGIGIHILNSDSKEIVEERLKNFVENLSEYTDKARLNDSFDLNKVLC